jgi:hypothetical protein
MLRLRHIRRTFLLKLHQLFKLEESDFYISVSVFSYEFFRVRPVSSALFSSTFQGLKSAKPCHFWQFPTSTSSIISLSGSDNLQSSVEINWRLFGVHQPASAVVPAPFTFAYWQPLNAVQNP